MLTSLSKQPRCLRTLRAINTPQVTLGVVFISSKWLQTKQSNEQTLWINFDQLLDWRVLIVFRSVKLFAINGVMHLHNISQHCYFKLRCIFFCIESDCFLSFYYPMWNFLYFMQSDVIWDCYCTKSYHQIISIATRKLSQVNFCKTSGTVSRDMGKIGDSGACLLHSLSRTLEPAIQSGDTGQQIPFFDSCQLTITCP